MKKVLLVEDDPNDEEMALRALRRAWPGIVVDVARDGDEAIAFLAAGDQNAIYDLVYLDIKLPRKNGHEVLESARADPKNLGVPIVMLSSSAEEGDVRRAYRLGANAFMQKPLDFELFMKNVAVSIEHWFAVNRCPR